MEALRGDFFNIKAGGTLFVSRTHKKNEIERVPKKMEGARGRRTNRRRAIVLTKARPAEEKKRNIAQDSFTSASVLLSFPLSVRATGAREYFSQLFLRRAKMRPSCLLSLLRPSLLR